MATARFLADAKAVAEHRQSFGAAVERRLVALAGLFSRLRKDGLPVDSIAPQGAIYLSARFDLIGADFEGKPIRTNEDIRRLLLEEAGIAAVPFQAFGYPHDDVWFRLSVGAVSEQQIVDAEPRLARAVGAIRLAAPAH